MFDGKQRILGPEHPSTLNCRTNILSVRSDIDVNYWETGRQTLQLHEKVLGLQHPATLTTVSNLALSLARNGQLVEAERLAL